VRISKGHEKSVRYFLGAHGRKGKKSRKINWKGGRSFFGRAEIRGGHVENGENTIRYGDEFELLRGYFGAEGAESRIIGVRFGRVWGCGAMGRSILTPGEISRLVASDVGDVLCLSWDEAGDRESAFGADSMN